MHICSFIFFIYYFMQIFKKARYLSINKFYYTITHYERKISQTFHLSKPISCWRNKELTVCATVHSGLCGSNNKRMCMEKRCRWKGIEERNRKRGKKRFKADQYFIFERRCHDGNRYLKIEKHERYHLALRTQKSG